MKAREFLLGLMIFLILGAWAATADVAEKDFWQPKAYGVAVSEKVPTIDPEASTSYVYDAMTTWRSIQLQAAAMTNPSKISNYVVLDSVPADKFLNEIEKAGGIPNAVPNWKVFHVGYLTDEGMFVAVDPEIYKCADCEDIDSWANGMKDFKDSKEYNTLLQTMGKKLGVTISVDDLHVVWQKGIAMGVPPEQVKKILVKPNY